MKLARPIVVLSLSIAAVSVMFLTAILLLPRLIDSQWVRDKIAADLSKQTQGRFIFGKISFSWLPLPCVTFENTQFSFNDNAQGTIHTAKIYPSILHLLAGRVVLSRALLEQPRIKITLPATSREPFDFEVLENQIRAFLVAVAVEKPAPRIDIANGATEIHTGKNPPVLLEDIAGQIAGSGVELLLEVSARSNLWEHLRLEGRIAAADLKANLQFAVRRLKIKDGLIPLALAAYAQRGEASFNVKIAAVGFRQVRASIDGSVGPVDIVRQGRRATLEAKRVTGDVVYKDGDFHIDVAELNLASPRLRASGQFKRQAGALSATLKARGIEVAETLGWALEIAGDFEPVARLQRYAPAGRIEEISLQSAGRSIADMASSKNIVISASLRNGEIIVPGPDLKLQNVSSSVRIAAGMLEAEDVSAHLGTIKGRNGKVRIGLEGAAAPFHVEITLQAAAAALHAVLLKLVRDEAVRAELLKIQNLDGELTGRLVLGDRLDAISPVIAVSQADISATYAPIPFPIAIRSAQLRYDQHAIGIENAQGSVGRSTFNGLGMTVQRGGSRRMKAAARQISLDLQQALTLLRSSGELRSRFQQLKAGDGQIVLDNLTLAGPYDDFAAWSYAGTGSFNGVEILYADFPDPVKLSRGKFIANPRQITLSETAAAMSDASWVGGGTLEYGRTGPLQLEGTGSGAIGAKMIQWLSRASDLPEVWQVRAPLGVAAEHFSWRAGGDVSFRGRVSAPDGALLTVAATKDSQGLTVENLAIVDGDRQARANFRLGKDKIEMSFSGELAPSTIDKMFASFPMKGVALQGDIRMSTALAEPAAFTAEGQLAGSNLVLPLGTERALIERFRVEASGSTVQLRSVDLLWGESRLAVSGQVSAVKSLLRVDADVIGDQLDWSKLQESFGSERNPRQLDHGRVFSLPAVEGIVRLKAERFGIDRFQVSPLELTANLSPSGVRAEIVHGVLCGITATGRLDVENNEIGLDLELSAIDAQLEPTTICLTDQQSDVKGTYSLTARVEGRGDRERLRSVLKGSFEFNARDGEFVSAAGLDATFDYLNASGDFAVNFPDLDKQAFPYRLLAAKGRLAGERMLMDEVIIQASSLTVTTQGSVDLQAKQIDLKGLVSVALPAHQVIKRIPLIGALVGGSLVGIPVRVNGPLERPIVTYLSPADVGMELLNVPMRILGAPLEAIKLFAPSGDGRD